jgi:hypothetical protein
LLGPREVDSLTTLVLAGVTLDSTRSGATRSLASFVAENTPDIFSVHGIDAGDALALATRFDLGWGYRGSQALFWKPVFHANAVHDLYLPAQPLRPFERRGLLRSDGMVDRAPLTLFASQFSDDRTQIREMRFARSAVRACDGAAFIFTANRKVATEFTDLGFAPATATNYSRELVDIVARGWSMEVRQTGSYRKGGDYIVIVARPSQGMPPPQTAGSQ